MQHVLTSGGTVEAVPVGSYPDGPDGKDSKDHVALNDFAGSCISVLVQTGVYSARSSYLFQDDNYMFDQELIKPTYSTENVDNALDLIFNIENYNPEQEGSTSKL